MEKRNKPATHILILMRVLQEQRDRSTPGSVPRRGWGQHPAQLHPRCHPNAFHWQTGWKCTVAVREPGYPAAGSSSWRNPKAPKTMLQKRAPKGALKCFCVVRFGKPGKGLDEAGKPQLTPEMASGHIRTRSHPAATSLSSQPGQNSIPFCRAGRRRNQHQEEEI